MSINYEVEALTKAVVEHFNKHAASDDMFDDCVYQIREAGHEVTAGFSGFVDSVDCIEFSEGNLDKVLAYLDDRGETLDLTLLDLILGMPYLGWCCGGLNDSILRRVLYDRDIYAPYYNAIMQALAYDSLHTAAYNTRPRRTVCNLG